MNQKSNSLSHLVHQAQYFPNDTRMARHAAPFYRPIIYGLTLLIVVVTIIKNITRPPLLVGGLFFAGLVYTAVFIWRIRMLPQTKRVYYQPHIQFIRGQISLLSVAMLILLLASYGINDHILWLLFVLATLLISEHNATPYVLFTLVEVAVVYAVALYLGWGFHMGDWFGLASFWSENNQMGSHILGIWLVTFVFHYLVRNIHGRNKAFNQQQAWLKLVSEQWIQANDPHKQQIALLQSIQQLTGAEATLWQTHIKNGRFFDQNGCSAPSDIYICSRQSQPTIYLPYSVNKQDRQTCTYVLKHHLQPHCATVILPIQRLNGRLSEPLAVLELNYTTSPNLYQLEMACANLAPLMDYARLLLISGMKNSLQRLEWELSFNMHQLIGTKSLAEQITNDIVEKMGFDFATVSLVDDDEDLIRGIAGKNAKWIEDSIHPLSRDDVQSRVVKENKRYQNEGRWEPYLNGRIWNKYRHKQLTRVWIPIPDPNETPTYPALGTIEAGFKHKNRRTIPIEMIQHLEQYANHVSLAFDNAERHQRKSDMAERLKMLNQISREIQRSATFHEPQQMVRFIGKSAEKLLDSDLVTFYTFNDNTEKLRLAYKTPQAILGKGKLIISLKSNLLNQLATTRKPYYSANAQHDRLLVNVKEGQHSRINRTFTQRQNIKSVVGLPLIDSRQNIMGFICINFRRRRKFYQEYRDIIELFADQATTALEKTKNHRLARRMAIVQERNHIAAELHHSLSQNLHGLFHYAETAKIYARRYDHERVIENVVNVQTTVLFALPVKGLTTLCDTAAVSRF